MKYNVINAVMNEKWLITEQSLRDIYSIANREGSVEALLKKTDGKLEYTREVEIRDSTAIIPVVGPIFRYANLFTEYSGAISTDQLTKDFNTALENPKIDRIIFSFDSPGGQVTGISDLSSLIYESRNKKEIISHVEGFGASAAYWLASSASKIYSSETGEVGSIGAVLTARKSKQDNTIEIVSTQSPYKRVDIESDEGKSIIQENIDDIAQVFIDQVAKNRGIESSKVLENYGKGKMLVASKALEAGMIDGIMTLEELIEKKTKQKNIVSFTKGGTMTKKQDEELVLETKKEEEVKETKAEKKESDKHLDAKNENERVTGLVSLFQKHGFSDSEQLTKCITDGTSVAEAGLILLDLKDAKAEKEKKEKLTKLEDLKKSAEEAKKVETTTQEEVSEEKTAISRIGNIFAKHSEKIKTEVR